MLHSMRMKTRKNLLLSSEAVARGERAAAARSTSLSKLVEEQLLSVPLEEAGAEEYWPGPPLKPISRPKDRRHDYWKRKHQ